MQRNPHTYPTVKLINLSVTGVSATSLVRLATPSLPSLPFVSFDSFLSCIHVPPNLADDVPLRLRFKVELISSYLRAEADHPNGKQGAAPKVTPLPGTRRAKPRLKSAASESFVIEEPASSKKPALSVNETYPLPPASTILELLELPFSPDRPQHVSTTRKQALAKLQLLMALRALQFDRTDKGWADSIRSGAVRSSLLKPKSREDMQGLQLSKLIVDTWEKELASRLS